MDINTISFPGLGIGEFKLKEVALSLFDGALTIRWYAIFICIGIILAYWYFLRHATKYEGLSEDTMINLVLFLIPISVIGARLLYVLTDDVKQDTFLEVIAVWQGGLAIYGAIIFGLLTALIFCAITKTNMLKVLDSLAPAVMIGQIIGRWGNFVNGEAYGYSEGVENLPWRMVVNGTATHPTFLYESLWNLIGFLIINRIYKNKKFNGQIFVLYIAWYGFGRAWIEFLRTDSLYVGSVKLMVVLGFTCFAAGIILYVILNARRHRDESELDEYIKTRHEAVAADNTPDITAPADNATDNTDENKQGEMENSNDSDDN